MKLRSILTTFERKPAQVVQRGIPRAEVVHGQPDTQLLDLPQHRGRTWGILEEHALGDLEEDLGRIRSGLGQQPGHCLSESGADDLVTRDVHSHVGDGLAVQVLPRLEVPAGLGEHPLTDREDHPGSFGDRQDDLGAHPAAVRMLPPQQRLDPEHAAALGGDDGLVGELELAAQHGGTHVPLELLAHVRLEPRGLVDDLMVSTTVQLGLVHREVGVTQQGLGDVLTRPGERQAHAGRHRQCVTVELEGFPQRGSDPLGHQLGSQRRIQVLAEDHELVAGQPCQRVSRPQHAGQPRRHRDQQLVSQLMAVLVVDELEAVEVDEQHRGHPPGPARAGDGAIQQLVQESTVGERCQRVVQGAMGELLDADGGLAARLRVEQVRRGDVRQHLGGRHVLRLKTTGRIAIEIQGTEAVAVHPHREREDRRQARGERPRRETREPRVHAEVLDRDCLAARVRLQARALLQLVLQGLDAPDDLVRRRDEVQVVLGHEHHAGAGHRQHVDDALDQMVQDCLDRELRAQGVGELHQDLGKLLVPVHATSRAGPGARGLGASDATAM